MQVRAANRLRFEEFDLDVGCRTLRRAGRTLDLRPRSFDVLVYLAEAAGRPVGKEEILAAVWPDVVVGEESSPDHQDVAETVRREIYLMRERERRLHAD